MLGRIIVGSLIIVAAAMLIALIIKMVWFDLLKPLIKKHGKKKGK